MSVGPGYFTALGLAIRRGRGIGGEDVEGAPPVGVVSERHAAQCWPGSDPIGRRFRQRTGADAPWTTVVGVAGDTMRTRIVPDGPQPVYVPVAQSRSLPGGLVLRAERDPLRVAKAVRVAIRRVDPTQPLESVEQLDQAFHQRFGGASLLTGVLGGFSAFALALATLGVFSVTSYLVAERTREFGIRIALGGTRPQILRLVLRHAAVIVAVGTAVSITGTLAVTRVTFREMADLASTDPVLWIEVAGLLAATAVAASILPARRATRVEPVVALRAE